MVTRWPLAALLWLRGDSEGAVREAALAVELPAADAGHDAVRLLALIVAAGGKTARRAALAALPALRAAPQLAERCNAEMGADVRRFIDYVVAIRHRGREELRDWIADQSRWQYRGDMLDPPFPDPFTDDTEGLKNVAAMRECARCGAKGAKLRRCNECRSAWYCNAECQRQHWSSHQQTCRLSAAVVALAGASVAALLHR